MIKRVCLLLSGCGAFDGSDIHETVLTLHALDRSGVEVICAAPDINQHHVINHKTQEEMDSQRNVLEESARLARGNIIDLASLNLRKIDALIMPGGYGAVKNLSPFALEGPTQDLNPQVRHILETLLANNIPMGAISVAAVTLVIALASHRPEVTVGNDAGTAKAIEKMGGRHQLCKPGQIVVDSANRIVTTPGSMLGTGIKQVSEGIERLVEKIFDLIG